MVSSRFQDPRDANNSYWSPDSVPSVKAQSWAANYRDGLCGIREMDEGYDLDDPALEQRCVKSEQQKRLSPPRQDCSEIWKWSAKCRWANN